MEKRILLTFFLVLIIVFALIQEVEAQTFWDLIKKFFSIDLSVIYGGVLQSLSDPCENFNTPCDCLSSKPLFNCMWYESWISKGCQSYYKPCNFQCYTELSAYPFKKEKENCGSSSECECGLKCIYISGYGNRCYDPKQFSCKGNALFYKNDIQPVATCVYCCEGSKNCGDMSACCRSKECEEEPSCSLSADPTSGIGPLKVDITVSFKDIVPGTITVDCGNGEKVSKDCGNGKVGYCVVNCYYDAVTSETIYTVSTSISNVKCKEVTIKLQPGSKKCSSHSECSQACTTKCPKNVYGCCYGCKLGQCIDGDCKCVDLVEYCSSTPLYQVGEKCEKTTSLSQSAYPPSPQPQGTTVIFLCDYTANNQDVTGATCYVNIDGKSYSTTYGQYVSGGYYAYGYSTSSLSVGTHSWYCSCSKSGYQSQVGSTQSYTITSVSTTTTTSPPYTPCPSGYSCVPSYGVSNFCQGCGYGGMGCDCQGQTRACNQNGDNYCCRCVSQATTTTTTTLPVDDPCDNSGTWRKYGIYCCEEDCSKDITKIRGFCLDKATYENNKDKLKLVKEGSNENCVSCTKEECCHELRSFCYDYSSTSPTGCEGDAGIVTLKCSSAGGNTCDYKQNLGGCTLKESGSKLGLLYCANCQAPPPPSTTTTTKPTTTTSSTTTTTSSTTTTTTTTLPPMPVIQCQECYARSKCECSLTTPCNNGFWVLQNKEANPLSSIITREIPPTTIQFEPNASGKILITTICYKDSQVETNQYTLEVKEPFLECDEDCEVLKPCECYVRGCKDGSFTAVLGNNVLKWKEKITTTDFVTSFISDKPGVVDVSVQCYDPMIYAEKEVPLGGEIRPTRVFSASNFRSTSLQGSYRIKLDYSNRLEEDVIIILTLSKNGKATNKKYVAEPGDGTANYLIDCEEFSGTYSVSWKAFKSSDRQNPIVWSKPEEMVTLTC